MISVISPHITMLAISPNTTSEDRNSLVILLCMAMHEINLKRTSIRPCIENGSNSTTVMATCLQLLAYSSSIPYSPSTGGGSGHCFSCCTKMSYRGAPFNGVRLLLYWYVNEKKHPSSSSKVHGIAPLFFCPDNIKRSTQHPQVQSAQTAIHHGIHTYVTGYVTSLEMHSSIISCSVHALSMRMVKNISNANIISYVCKGWLPIHLTIPRERPYLHLYFLYKSLKATNFPSSIHC